MALAANHHDRDTGVLSRDARHGALDAALRGLRLAGAIFFRSEFTEAWSYQTPLPGEMADALHPGAKRLIMFHIVATGRCWVEVDGSDRVWADEGDVIVLPYGDQHSVGGTEPATIVSILDLMDPQPWQALPVVRHGSGGLRTDIVCGYLHSEHPLFNPALGAFPRAFVVRPPGGPAARWIRSSIDYAVAMSNPAVEADPSATRLPELVLTETLKLHLAGAPAIGSGWLAALGDAVLAPALARLHAEPARHWTVEQLAATVAVSRSLLDERFRQLLGVSPIRYLTEWRMHLAQDLLATTDQPVGAIARRVGYDSEEAFSRAFKRAHAVAPGAWRQRRNH